MPYQSRALGTPGRLSRSGYARDITANAPAVHERYATSLSRYEPIEQQEPIPIGRFLLGALQDIEKTQNQEIPPETTVFIGDIRNALSI